MSAASAFKYSESRLSHEINVSRTYVRSLREDNLKQGVHWQKNPGGEVLLTQKGVNAILDLTSKSIVDLDLCLAQKNGARNQTQIMRVVPPMPMNPRVVLAENDDGKRLLVDVGRNGTFCFGDQIEVKTHPVQTGILQLVSPIPRDRRRPR